MQRLPARHNPQVVSREQRLERQQAQIALMRVARHVPMQVTRYGKHVMKLDGEARRPVRGRSRARSGRYLVTADEQVRD